jgi:hypothetical protein
MYKDESILEQMTAAQFLLGQDFRTKTSAPIQHVPKPLIQPFKQRSHSAEIMHLFIEVTQFFSYEK